ncbi:hypothetical protein niasHS_015261 [Heterodera schachtii]|uniref:Uncharacterized protein n=2 Tax=Heterodera TaxID=34509 RepID=A0ABD2I5J4_HETSC
MLYHLLRLFLPFFVPFLSFLPLIFGVNSDSERPSWQLSVLDGLRFVHCSDDHSRGVIKRDEQKLLDWMGEQRQCFGDAQKHFSLPNRFFRQIRSKINAWNAKLSELKKCTNVHNYYKKFRLLNTIRLIFRAQNITIVQYFLDMFLNNTEQKQLGKIIRILEKQRKVFDMSRYEKKMEANEADLESITFQLETNFKQNEFKFNYNIVRKIKNELAKVKLEWTENDQREASKFWTIDKRPLVRQTLYLVRHAEKLDIIDKSWSNDKNELEREDSPLSPLGLRQADELGKWFDMVNVDRLYASPFKRCLETADGLIGGEKGGRGIGIEVEPGLAEFYGQSAIKVGFEDAAQSQNQFSLIDPNYWPVFNRNALVIIEIERRKRQRNANDRDFVMLQTIRHILQNNEKAENIVLVSHLSNIGLLLQRMGVEWVAVGQASITKLIRYEENIGNSPDLLQQFRMEFASEIGHLTERADYIFGV